MSHLEEEPVNREPPVPDLISSFITRKNGYDRNHSPHPHLDGSEHRVRVDGAVSKPLALSTYELKTDFQQHSVVCALQCAGNRRHTMRTLLKEVSGIDWFDGAVMNCKWTGPRLRDVLQQAGITLNSDEQKSAHVAFACHQAPCEDAEWYGASIALERALSADADVILAWAMNDEPLKVAHGYPIRVVTPGLAGARAVKWLDRVTVQTGESQNHYQQRDYKVLPPEVMDVQSAEKYWALVPAVQEMPINSVVAVPLSGSTVRRNAAGLVEVKGYALPSGDHGPVTRVEVSGDGGETWTDALLLHFEDEGRWSWKLWTAEVRVLPGADRIVYSRATDTAGNTQPKTSEWNLRGVCYNGYGDARDLTVI